MSRRWPFRLPWRRPNLMPLPPLVPRDRRQAARAPAAFPLLLRLGGEAFPGVATDLGLRGLGLWFPSVTDSTASLRRALAEHERGALEVSDGRVRSLARVRIAHTRAGSAGTQVGLAFAAPGDGERLIHFLDEHGVPTEGAR